MSDYERAKRLTPRPAKPTGWRIKMVTGGVEIVRPVTAAERKSVWAAVLARLESEIMLASLWRGPTCVKVAVATAAREKIAPEKLDHAERIAHGFVWHTSPGKV